MAGQIYPLSSLSLCFHYAGALGTQSIVFIMPVPRVLYGVHYAGASGTL